MLRVGGRSRSCKSAGGTTVKLVEKKVLQYKGEGIPGGWSDTWTEDEDLEKEKFETVISFMPRRQQGKPR